MGRDCGQICRFDLIITITARSLQFLTRRASSSIWVAAARRNNFYKLAIHSYMELNRWRAEREKLQRTRRCPEASVLYGLVYHYRNELQWRWEDLFQWQYGALRAEVLKSLDKYLNCGILVHGCARAVCEACGHSELISFSCKRRCICSSCDAKRAVIFAENLHSNVLPPYPISHQVYTIPKRLRPYFKFNRKLHKHLYHAALGAWCELIEDEFSGYQSGAVMALHSAGDLLNWHPHNHALMLHGAVDETGVFHRLELIETGQNEPTVRYHTFKDNLSEQHRDFTPLEFLAELSQHIPDQWEQTIRYMGTLSARTRGAKRLHKPVNPVTGLSEIEPPAKPSRSWAACMKRIFEIDPLCCSQCGAKMHIKAFITTSSEIERLCKNLGVIACRAPPPFPKTPSEWAA